MYKKLNITKKVRSESDRLKMTAEITALRWEKKLQGELQQPIRGGLDGALLLL